ncbi:hypothetical protein P9272_13720 [Mesorhizobium sp. WSM4976]|uniref:DUF6864 domain-containing function n=1 Tax=Mesorhizobium sp. WSM4976 TaxID=3038549 RepID=UPI0024165955|nr:hypothetical protein [Mesorhizobium sp. WSM4976]MDG4894631.1 hypothetical protein [Mesorhizobium sp. WSM4976]
MALTPLIYAGNRLVLASGTVVSAGFEPVKIFPFAPTSGYSVELVFEDNQLKPPAVNVEVIGPNHLRGIVTNFNNPIGIATSSPLHIATNSDGHKILLHLACYFIGSGDAGTRILHYSLLDGGNP